MDLEAGKILIHLLRVLTNINDVYNQKRNMKIIIINIDTLKAIDIAKYIGNSITPTFTTNQEYKEKNIEHIYWLNEDQLSLDFKNNSLLYVITNNEEQYSWGISIDNYLLYDIVPMSIKAFNMIKNNYINDVLIVWVDSKINKKDYSKIDYQSTMIESNFLIDKLNTLDNMLYFSPSDSVEYIKNTIDEYLKSDEDKRKEIKLNHN